MDSIILAAIIGGFVGGLFAVIVTLIALIPYINQLREDAKERERQKIRDYEMSSYFQMP